MKNKYFVYSVLSTSLLLNIILVSYLYSSIELQGLYIKEKLNAYFSHQTKTLETSSKQVSNRQYYAFAPKFKGLTVGHSTKKDVISVLGKPTGMTNNGRNYLFGNIEMTIRSGKGGINSIIIHDKDFIDLNGYKIGTHYDTIKNNSNVKYPGRTLIERSNGIIYWFKDKRVSKIVYASGLMLVP